MNQFLLYSHVLTSFPKENTKRIVQIQLKKASMRLNDQRLGIGGISGVISICLISFNLKYSSAIVA